MKSQHELQEENTALRRMVEELKIQLTKALETIVSATRLAPVTERAKD